MRPPTAPTRKAAREERDESTHGDPAQRAGDRGNTSDGGDGPIFASHQNVQVLCNFGSIPRRTPGMFACVRQRGIRAGIVLEEVVGGEGLEPPTFWM